MFRGKQHNFLNARRFAWFKKEHPALGGARVALLVALVVFGSLAVLVLPFWFLSDRVHANAERGRQLLANAEAAASRLDFEEALSDVQNAEAAFVAAQENLVKLAPLEPLPYIGPNLVAADRLLTSGISATSAAGAVFAIGRDVVAVARETEGVSGAPFTLLPDPSTLFKDLTRDQKRRILAAFAESGPKLAEALLKIDEALYSFDQIPAADLAGPFRDTLAPIRAKLVNMRAAIAAVQPLVGTVPGILGYPEAKNYLFFFENNTELRPTGGFLGVFGSVTVQDAEIEEMLTKDVYALDGPAESSPRPAPPDPIRKYIGVDKWYLRDANWSPDFPTSAATMQKFFREEAAIALGGAPVPPVDGIIAITPKFAEDILRLTGPITIDGKTFDADNLVDELEFEVEQGFVKDGIPFTQRKDIVGTLVKELVARLSSFPISRLIEAVAVIDEDIKEGHILLHSSDPALQKTILANGWGGIMKPVEGDFLMYVDANLAALKTDAVMDRSVSYRIAPATDPGSGSGAGSGYEGRVAMTYKNKGSFTWKTTRYRTYARLYVPPGTTLTGSSGAMENDKLKDPARRPGKVDVTDELGRRAFGAFISIEPGETKTLEFRFRLAPSVVEEIKNGRYELYVQKQAGTLAHGLTLDLDFGKKLSNAVPAEDRSKWGDARYSFGTDLRIDRVFNVSF